MPARPLNDIEAREAFHVHLLRFLVDALPHGTWRVKGGVNLRLFFRSVRYSEAMDLDADLRVRDALRRELRNTIKDQPLRAALGMLGIRDVHQAGREIAKDTETTLRLKMQVIAQGGVPLPTKVEVSFRPGCADDTVLSEAADHAITARYLAVGVLPLMVPHYTQLPAVRQKLAALALRTHVQARDVFDLFAITGGVADGLDLDLLRKNLADATLQEARTRALEMPYEAYAGTVLEFLDEPGRAAWSGRWEEQQLFVADLAESLLARPRGVAKASGYAVKVDDDKPREGEP